jgi:hypothetical protein
VLEMPRVAEKLQADVFGQCFAGLLGPGEQAYQFLIPAEKLILD